MNAEPLTHEAASDLFSAYLEQELALPQQDRFEDHLDACDRCRGEYQEFAEAVALVRGVPRHRAPRGFARRVARRTSRSRQRGLAAGARDLAIHRHHVEVGALVLLAAALAILLLFLLGGPHG